MMMLDYSPVIPQKTTTYRACIFHFGLQNMFIFFVKEV